MKKITFGFFMMILPYLGFAQVINEGFEGATFPPTTPGNWITMDNGVGTGVSWTETNDPTRVHAGLKAAIMDRENVGAGNTSIDWLVTPQFLVPTNGQLRFFTRQTLLGPNGSIYEIRVSTDPSQTNQAAYTTIQTWTESSLNATYNVYEEKLVSLSAYAGQQIYVAFVKVNTQPTGTTSGDRWLIDEVNVVQQCLDPSILGVGTITPTTAVLTWQNNGGATLWDIYYNQQSDPTVPIVTTTPSFNDVNTNNYTATGFTPGTSYKYWVRTQCAGSNVSNWVGPFNFTTSPAGSICAAPIFVTGLPYSHTANTSTYGDEVDTAQGAGCAGGATNYMQGAEVFYSYTSTFTGNITVSMTPGAASSSLYVYNGCANVGVSCLAGVADATSNPRNIVTLPVVTGQTYIFVISSSTTPVAGIPYTLIIQQKFCDPPTTLSANSITTTTANLSWANPSGATAWQVVVQDAGLPIPSGAGTDTTINTNYPVSGLIAAHAYEYWVRSDCGGGLFSPWAGPFRFSTEICDAAQKCNYVFRLTDSASDGWDGALMQVRQNGIVVATLGSTFTSGAGPVNTTVALCENYPLELYWHVAGSWPSEVGISVINNFGQTIFTKPAGTGSASTTTPLFASAFDCDTPACLMPTALTDTAPTTQGATLNWTPNGGTQWDVYVVPANPPSPPPTASTVPTHPGVTVRPLIVTGLNPNTTYLYYVRTVCSSTQTSDWTASGDFTTLPTCSRPTTPVTSGVTPYTATLNWTQPVNPDGSNATTWEIIVLPCGSPAPTEGTPTPYPGAITTTVKPYTVSALTPVSCYDFYVRAVCSSTDNSPWSVKGTFNTPDINDECINSKLVPVNQNTNCTQTVYGTVAGATASSQANTCGATADNDDVWFHFTATATTHYISLLEASTSVQNPPFYPNAAPGGLNYSLYRGNDCGALTQISCRTTNGGMETGLVIGDTYKIRVYSPGTAVSTKRFEICVGTKVIYCENAIPVCAVNDVILRNDVGVPANPNPISGTTTTTVGCLGSAPSPTFYYLTVQADGNYTYFMEQSTAPDFSDPLTNGLDVDYVTWGPFSSVATACSSISVSNTRPAPLGCSFSAADTETFTLNGALAGQVYVIMITNYTTSSSYPGKRGYIRIKRTAGPAPLDCCPFASFTYPSNFVCKGGANPVPSLSPGSTAGTYSCSNPAMVINPTTGEVDLAATPVGTYTITSTIIGTGGCNNSIDTWSMTISDPANATISYSAPAFCKDVTAPQPVTQTGTTGGYYYATPSGLSINASTGAITPSTSLVGTYTVRYNVVVPGCTSTPFETTVTITALPVATFNYSALPYCQNAGNATPTFTGGGVAGVFTVSPSTGLVIDGATGVVDLAASTVGTYTVTNTIAAAGGCGDVIATASITITALPIATFNYDGSPYCQSVGTATPTFTGGGVAGTFTATPAGLSIDAATGVVDLTNSTAGNYTVTNTIPAANGCQSVSSDATIVVRVNPMATIDSSDADNTICSNDSATLTVNPSNFVLTDATYAWTLNGAPIAGTGSSISPTATGTYGVTITLNGCTNTTPITIAFTVNFKPNFTLTGTNLTKCINEVSVLTVTPINYTTTDPVAYSWTLNGSPIAGTTNSISVTDYGMYEVTVNNQGCITTQQIEVSMDMTDIPIDAVGDCQGAQFVITASPVNGSFDGATATYEWTNESNTVVGTNQNTFNVSQYVSANGIPLSSFPMTFTVKITTNPDGCTDTQSFTVQSPQCVIPRGLSPNGDGDNDNFDLTSLGVKKLSIFNRYGSKVYDKANYTNQWRGQSDSDQELPDGTYYYVIEQNSGETKTGWVYINR